MGENTLTKREQFAEMTEELPLFAACGDEVQPAFEDGRLYLRIDEHPRYHHGYSSHVNAGGCVQYIGPFSVVHVMSRPAGGEIRGYVRIDGMLYLRTPTYCEWDELDVEVSRQLGCPVMTKEPAR